MKLSLNCYAVLASALIGQSALAADPTYTGLGTITMLEAGWSADTVSVTTSAPIINPAFCPITSGGYVTDPNDAGRHLFQSMLQEALWRNRAIRLLISGTVGDCPYGKPRIIAVNVKP